MFRISSRGRKANKRENRGPGAYQIRRRRRIILSVTVLVVVLITVGFFGWNVWNRHTIKTIYVEGNVHYTQEEIIDMVMKGSLGRNSLYLAWKYKGKTIHGIPFLDTMDVDILTEDTIKIKVIEKAMAGCVKYMDTYVYFDKDGCVVESSSMKTRGVPQITGLEYEYFAVGQPLPVKEEDREIFTKILELTKLMNKYDLVADKIHFHSNSEITLYFANVKVELGNEPEYLEDKVMQLPNMLLKLEERRGTLQMEKYIESRTYTFKPE